MDAAMRAALQADAKKLRALGADCPDPVFSKPCPENWQSCDFCGAAPNELCKNPDVQTPAPEPGQQEAGRLPPERGLPRLSRGAVEAVLHAQEGAVPPVDRGAARPARVPSRDYVGLVGHKRVGKDTAARALEDHGFANIKFAEPLKDMLCVFLQHAGFGPETIGRMIDGDLKEIEHPALMGRSPRYLMETLGTEWGRNLVRDDVWVTMGIDRAKRAGKAVFTDCRFPNEVEAVRQLGGQIVRIKRPSMETEVAHASTQHIDQMSVDAEVFNIASSEEDFEKVAGCVFHVIGLTG